MKNYYEILGISPDATKEEIERVYRSVAKEFANGKITKKQLDEATEMYDILIDDFRREIYDERLNEFYEQEAFEEYKNEIKNKATKLISDTKELLVKLGDNVTEENKSLALTQISELEQVLASDSDDLELIKSKKLALAKTADLLEKQLNELEQETKKESRLKVNNAAKRILSGTLVIATLTGFALGGYACGKNSVKNNSNNNNNDNNNDTNVDTKQEEVVEKPIVLTADNFEATVNTIIMENHLKGLTIRPEIVSSALLLTNLNHLSDSDLAKLASNVNMQEELQNLLNYISMVETHNLNKNNEYISLYTLAYDKLDREMLQELDNIYKNLVVNINDSEFIDNTINNTYEFTIGSGTLKTESGEYSKLNLGDGAGLLAESYVNLTANEVRNVTGTKYKDEIDAIAELTNGLSYINGIYKTEIPCVEQEKTLTK